MNKFIKWASGLSLLLMLTACQETASDETAATSDKETESINTEVIETGDIEITGLAHHYHSGDEIELNAELAEESEMENWNWYIKDSEQEDWKVVRGLNTSVFSREATTDGLQIKAVLKDEEGQLLQESESAEVIIDDHHGNDETTRRIYNGFFYDTEIEDRDLSDWEGDWQSVYPYHLSGELDVVYEAKAKNSDTMTFNEYKDYYDTGYATDVERVVIEDDSFAFFYEDGTEIAAEYEYDGFEVLVYSKGNRGVRFIYSRTDGSDEMPQYIQFSDHIIYPKESDHFHLYWGDDREELLDEVTNWPTYYPSNLNSEGLVRDMLAH